jgi:hypothetical protein
MKALLCEDQAGASWIRNRRPKMDPGIGETLDSELRVRAPPCQA